MRRIVLVSFLLAIAPLALAADRRIHKTLALDANGRVSISTHNGSVTITAWNQPSIDIEARIEPGDYREDVDRTKVSITGSASNLLIESDYRDVSSHVVWFGVNKSLPPIHYTISMPATAQLQISGHNASIRVSGLRSDADIQSHNGRVDLSDFDGAADVETHNGNISVGFSRFAKTSHIETHNGTAEVRVPADAKFHLDASGHDLGFDSDFAVVASRMSGSHYAGDVNGGGPELRFESHNGTLKLRKR